MFRPAVRHRPSRRFPLRSAEPRTARAKHPPRPPPFPQPRSKLPPATLSSHSQPDAAPRPPPPLSSHFSPTGSRSTPAPSPHSLTPRPTHSWPIPLEVCHVPPYPIPQPHSKLVSTPHNPRRFTRRRPPPPAPHLSPVAARSIPASSLHSPCPPVSSRFPLDTRPSPQPSGPHSTPLPHGPLPLTHCHHHPHTARPSPPPDPARLPPHLLRAR